MSALSCVVTDETTALRIYYLGHGGLRVQHQVLEGSLEHPAQLVEERAVVGDGAGLGAGGTLLVLHDAVQLRSGVAGVAAVFVLLDQAALDALPRDVQVLKVQL